MKRLTHRTTVYRASGGHWVAVCSCGLLRAREGLREAAREAAAEHVAAAELAEARAANERGVRRRSR